jgi:uncharacterized BrkB/YihY/UPF0761 family membrane protein
MEGRPEETPSRAARIRSDPQRPLIPGAAVLAMGLQLLHAIVVYVITPWAIARQGTYGALGVAAALLVGLFLISRLMVVAAVVNATLWERQARAA